jgi:hypothetical protein
MSGSLYRFLYGLDRDDGGVPGYIVLNLDESNQRAIGNKPTKLDNNIERPNICIKRIEPRYIYWQGITSKKDIIRRKIVVCDQTNNFYQFGGPLKLKIAVGDHIEDIEGYITGSVGEKKTFVPPKDKDSGQTDG